jgi:hypothetical protein
MPKCLLSNNDIGPGEPVLRLEPYNAPGHAGYVSLQALKDAYTAGQTAVKELKTLKESLGV